MIPVEGSKVGQAYKRAILGAQTGRVYKGQRTAERELLPMAEGFGLAVMGWSPMAAGILTGKYKKGERGRVTELKASVRHADHPHNDAVVAAVASVAEEIG